MSTNHSLDHIEEKIVKMYTSHVSGIKIADELSVSIYRVYSTLKQNGIPMRPRTDMNKKYSINRNYFSVIDSKEKAYLLGLIYADGCNHKNTFTLELQENDINLVNQVGRLIGCNTPIRTRKSRGVNQSNHVILNAFDKIFCESLSKLGVVPNKTNTLAFPKFLSEELYSSFILGYHDGDGCLHVSKRRNTHEIVMVFTGSHDMISDLQKIIYDKLKVSGYFHSKKGQMHGTGLRYCGTKALTILNWLYRNCSNTFMKRKYDKYKDIISILAQKNPNNRLPRTKVALAESVEIIKSMNSMNLFGF